METTGLIQIILRLDAQSQASAKELGRPTQQTRSIQLLPIVTSIQGNPRE